MSKNYSNDAQQSNAQQDKNSTTSEMNNKAETAKETARNAANNSNKDKNCHTR